MFELFPVYLCTVYFLIFFPEVSFVKRKTGEFSTTYIEITVNGDAWRWKYQIAHKKGDLTFKLGEEFNEVTADDRKVKVGVKFCLLLIS